MKFLAIDTSGKEVLVVARNEDACSIVEIMPEINVSTSVMGAISQALADVSLTPAELEMIAAVVGPGSFTGLRIGVSVANGMAYALSCKRLAVMAFDVLLLGRAEDCVALIPSRVGCCYSKQGAVCRELTPEEISLIADSVGLVAPANHVLSRAQYAANLDKYCVLHFEESTTQALEPVYLKKSQAERLRHD